MPEKEMRTMNHELGTTRFSRRQFLERLGITTGGAFVAALSLASACKTTSPTSTPDTDITGTNTPTSTPTTTPTTAPTTGQTTTSTIIPATTSTTAPVFSYTPGDDLPPLIKVPDTDCTVATDRLYSIDHVWVKLVSSDTVVIGITPTLVKIIYDPHEMTLPDVGLKLAKDDFFTSMVGWKISADIFSPVSGTIIQVNEGLRPYLRSNSIQPINNNPYTYGWIIAVKLSNPGELDDLMNPQAYVDRVVKGNAQG